MKIFALSLILSLSLSAHAVGPAVSGGNLGICDLEKDAVLQLFVERNVPLEGMMQALDTAGFRKSCVIGSSDLILPSSDGLERNKFHVQFSNGIISYKLTIHYQATRSGMGAGYRGHAPGAIDGTVLSAAELLSFDVTPGTEPTGGSPISFGI
jgi:hypothetical protein